MHRVHVYLVPGLSSPPTPEDTCYYKNRVVYCCYTGTDDVVLKGGIEIGEMEGPRVKYRGMLKLLTAGNGYKIPALVDSEPLIEDD